MKLTLAAVPAALMLSLAAAAANDSDSPTLPLSTDSAFNFQFLITLGDAITGGADIGPVLGAAKNIVPGDFASFSSQFYALANDTKAQAADPENAYDGVNVRETWFSASQYFRRADFYLHNDVRRTSSFPILPCPLLLCFVSYTPTPPINFLDWKHKLYPLRKLS